MARQAISRPRLLPGRRHIPLAHHRPGSPPRKDGPAEGDEPSHKGVPRLARLVHRRAGLPWGTRRICAIDSTDFSIWRYARWLGVRHGRRKDFLKLHFVVDRRSLLILSFKVTPPFKADSKQVEELLKFIGRLGRLC
ncbi:MAG: transposase, partial [Nitrososphaerota archaeon]|nr:transposase [Nitrososphaerota archaeon]